MFSSPSRRLLLIRHPTTVSASCTEICIRCRLFSSQSSAASAATATPVSTSLETCREQLLASAATYYVHEHGWTRRAIVEAAAATYPSLSLSVAGLVASPQQNNNNNNEDPSLLLIHYLMKSWNQQLQQDLAQYCNNNNNNNNENNNTHSSSVLLSSSSSSSSTTPSQRVVFAVSTRLSYMKDYIHSKRWPAAMALGVSSPSAAATTRLHLQETINLVVDFVVANNNNNNGNPPLVLSETSKAMLGAIYVATELHLLTDSYPFTETWKFLEHRAQEWERLFLPNDSYSSSSSSSTQPAEMMLSAADALSVAWTVSTAFASGIQSVLMPQGIAAAKAGGAESSSSTNDALSQLLKNLQPPSRPPTLPILGEPPEPFVDLWTSVFNDFYGNAAAAGMTSSDTSSKNDNNATTTQGTQRRKGTDPSDYDAPPSPYPRPPSPSPLSSS